MVMQWIMPEGREPWYCEQAMLQQPSMCETTAVGGSFTCLREGKAIRHPVRPQMMQDKLPT